MPACRRTVNEAGAANGYMVSTFSPPTSVSSGGEQASYTCPGGSDGAYAQCDGGICFKSTQGKSFPGFNEPLAEDEIICSCPITEQSPNQPVGYQIVGPYPCQESFFENCKRKTANKKTGSTLYVGAPTGTGDLLAFLLTGMVAPAQQVSYVYPPVAAKQAPWQYIDTNYILAGIIIARATGRSYEDVLNKVLLEPLRLDETYYRPRVPPKRVLDAMASGYFGGVTNAMNCTPPPSPFCPLVGQDLKTMNLSIFGAAGGIVASMPEVTRWARALFSDELLPPKQQTELFSLVSEATGQPIATTSPADPFGFALAIGQGWYPFTESPIWEYEGQTPGYLAKWWRRPGDHLVVAIAINSSASPDRINELYQPVLGILEPQSVIDPSAPAPAPIAAREAAD